MPKNGKKRIIIEVDEETYEKLKQLKQQYNARTWADLLIGCIDNSKLMEEITSIKHSINNIQKDVRTIIKRLEG